MNARDIRPNKLKCIVYGQSGTGKTEFACTFPKPFVIDLDNGMLSQMGKDVEYETCKTYEQFMKYVDLAEKDDKIETIVIDSVTMLQELMQHAILTLNNKKNMDLKCWAVLVDMFQQLFTGLTYKNKHVIVTAHEQLIQDEITGAVQILPLIVGRKLPNQLPLFFDEVYRAVVNKKLKGSESTYEYSLITRADSKATAKSRLRLPALITPPTYGQIMKLLKEKE